MADEFSAVDTNVTEPADAGLPVDDGQEAGAEQPAEQVEELYAGDFMQEKPSEETDVKPADVGQQPKITSQKDFNKALSERLGAENARGYQRAKAEFEQSPEYQLVRALISDRAREKGITEADALRDLQNDRIRQMSENYAKNPAQFYEDLLTGKTNFQSAQPNNPNGLMSAEELARQMADSIRAGEVPEGFDVQKLDTGFLDDVNRYKSVSAALRIWKAEHTADVKAQQIATELQRRQKAPKPMSPTSANPSSPSPPDYAHMSSEEFRRLDQQIQKAALEGKKVRLY